MLQESKLRRKPQAHKTISTPKAMRACHAQDAPSHEEVLGHPPWGLRAPLQQPALSDMACYSHLRVSADVFLASAPLRRRRRRAAAAATGRPSSRPVPAVSTVRCERVCIWSVEISSAPLVASSIIRPSVRTSSMASTSSVPSVAAAAVLQESEPMPDDAKAVRGYDFNEGNDLAALLASFSTTGFQVQAAQR
eukprot:6183646-Pleurochrysis_carterae.AAC.1